MGQVLYVGQDGEDGPTTLAGCSGDKRSPGLTHLEAEKSKKILPGPSSCSMICRFIFTDLSCLKGVGGFFDVFEGGELDFRQIAG